MLGGSGAGKPVSDNYITHWRPAFAGPRSGSQAHYRTEAALEVRLVQLLGSFIGVCTEYTLARLELAYRHPALPAPPTIDRPPDASENTLRDRWPAVEDQLEAAVRYVKQMETGGSTAFRKDAAFGWLERSIRQLDQYARAVRWVLTVTEQEEHHE